MFNTELILEFEKCPIRSTKKLYSQFVFLLGLDSIFVKLIPLSLNSFRISYNAPENSSQKITITGDSFDVKISTPDSSNDIDESFKGKANLSWTSTSSGETIIVIQNTGESEFTEDYRFELERDPLFFTYSILVIIAGIVIIGFSAGFSAKKPKGF